MLRTSSDDIPQYGQSDLTLEKYCKPCKPVSRTANPGPNRIETVDQFLDAESGGIYAMTHFEEGVPQKSILKKEAWEKARQLMDSV